MNKTPQKEEPKKEESKKDELKEVQPSKGEVLKQARLRQGLSLEAIHEVTKIPMDSLRAIEEGYTIRTMSDFYYKGFLKIYAQYLDVDVTEVIDDYHKEALPKHINGMIEKEDVQDVLRQFFTKERMKKIVIVGGILLGFLLLFTMIRSCTKGEPKQSTKKVVQAQKSTPKVQKPVQKSQSKVRVKKVATPKPAPKSIPKPVVKTQVAKTVVAPKSFKSPSSAVNKNVILTVRAKKNSWLRVKTDGDTVFQSTLNLGEVETWMANESIEISGKNINQLEFELNGKMIGSLGRKDSKAKKLVVTKDGLTVTQ